MRQSLRSHILYLENAIQDLRTRLTSSELTVDQLQDIELQLAQASSALHHYREAYELELKVFGPEPPDDSADHSKDRPGSPTPHTSDKKKNGLAASGVRARKRRTRRSSLEVSFLLNVTHSGAPGRSHRRAR